MPINHELSWQAWSGFLTSERDVWEAAMAELDSRHPTFDVAWAWAIAFVQLRRPHRDRRQPWSAVATQVGASTGEARMHSTAIAALIGARSTVGPTSTCSRRAPSSTPRSRPLTWC